MRRSGSWVRLLLAAAVFGTALTACGSGSAGGEPAVSLPDAPTRYGVDAMVLDAGDGPMLCVDSVLDVGRFPESNSPLCGGPPVAGWDWTTVDHDTDGAAR